MGDAPPTILGAVHTGTETADEAPGFVCFVSFVAKKLIQSGVRPDPTG
jgi:hypothetical protein